LKKASAYSEGNHFLTDEDVSSSSLEEESKSSAFCLRKGRSRDELKKFMRDKIKSEEKRLVQIELSIRKTNGQINFNRFNSPNEPALSMQTYRSMRRILGFEAQLGKARKSKAGHFGLT
jgi:hypothetical protein